MHCPRCGFEGEPVEGGCARCGYGRVKVPSGGLRNGNSLRNQSPFPVQPNGSFIANQSPSSAKTFTVRTLKRGDLLRRGRYRLLEQLTLPENQQDQGTAWFATDTQSPNLRVIIREIALPGEDVANKERIVRSIASRMAELAQHPGFPKMLDVFNEQGTYYIVLQHVEGESLASALRRQGGALPERIVA